MGHLSLALSASSSPFSEDLSFEKSHKNGKPPLRPTCTRALMHLYFNSNQLGALRRLHMARISHSAFKCTVAQAPSAQNIIPCFLHIYESFCHLAALTGQLFYSFFKTLIGQEVLVELKNDLAMRGVLHSVDQFLNIKLRDITVVEADKYPHLVAFRFAAPRDITECVSVLLRIRECMSV
jgi:small nuclear ribonucleoprotein (snRNP)-like protein